MEGFSNLHSILLVLVHHNLFAMDLQLFNISSCVPSNGFSTQPFAVERGVTQGDPLSTYLFITELEILC